MKVWIVEDWTHDEVMDVYDNEEAATNCALRFVEEVFNTDPIELDEAKKNLIDVGWVEDVVGIMCYTVKSK